MNSASSPAAATVSGLSWGLTNSTVSSSFLIERLQLLKANGLDVDNVAEQKPFGQVAVSGV